ncbi:hypothetical protein IPV08_03835 [Methylobacterium sp. SD274]|uniref:hypothetical protein n=1 Tax=Methylobacterium sp. SD274 TaxID=2782009 RepID=UPI001A97846E|nr:hypothetical protein [Methylobacterium sp. SD274]MBO1019098.1 hypothetical protein [Methylobacterium sp. SD274]
MSRSGWRYVFAFGGVGVLAGIFLAAALLTTSPQPNRESGAKQSKTGQTEQKSFSTIARSVEAIEQGDSKEEKWPCKPGQDNRNSDLCAQWKAADSASDAALWGMLSFIVGIFGTIGLLINIIYTHRAVSVADNAVTESRRLGEVQARAYIQIVSQETSVIVDPDSDGIFPHIEMLVKNTGQTPARDVKIVARHSKIWMGSTNFPDAEALDFPGTKILEMGTQEQGKLVLSPLGYTVSNETIAAIIARSPRNDAILSGTMIGYITFDDVFGINRSIRFTSDLMVIVQVGGSVRSIQREFRAFRMPDEEARPADRWRKLNGESWTLEQA